MSLSCFFFFLYFFLSVCLWICNSSCRIHSAFSFSLIFILPWRLSASSSFFLSSCLRLSSSSCLVIIIHYSSISVDIDPAGLFYSASNHSSFFCFLFYLCFCVRFKHILTWHCHGDRAINCLSLKPTLSKFSVLFFQKLSSLFPLVFQQLTSAIYFFTFVLPILEITVILFVNL